MYLRGLLSIVISVFILPFHISAQTKTADEIIKVIGAQKKSSTVVEVKLSNGQHYLFDFYGNNIFRLLQDSLQHNFRPPYSKPAAEILVSNPRRPLSDLDLNQRAENINISTNTILVQINKNTCGIKIFNKTLNQEVAEMITPAVFEKNNTIIKLSEKENEFFYGGGVQNGRFSHKGHIIKIENENSWTDGGVASPNSFYWSTKGYGFMWYTFKKGKYDFGKTQKGRVILSAETNYTDVFFMIDEKPEALLSDYYQLTGNPVLLPKFGFYEGHLNAYNRDYWKKDSSGILFEDGNRYKESQKENGGIKESLNGEKNNYQFSARAVIDRYKNNDLPLGWILPNDGYGAGYGQSATLDSNIQNLKSFGDYARKNGVQIGLWTQSDLHPKDGVPALLQRDIVKEVGTAGVRVLKTDVAWVGAGYSFGLNGITDVSHIMSDHGNDARPFIISLDGWAGTQRHAAVWTGDQTGGLWEYIRFHIPTYIGSGLSGEPNITSDMDGIFGGQNPIVNARDFEWKAFTPMQLNMDGWGANPKYPSALNEPATSINRTYLKLKSELIPYTYSIAKQAVTGFPIIRPTFLDYPNVYTHGKSTQYQYMYGPYFLIAPVYQSTRSDSLGNDIRNNIYLPQGKWIDYFSGEEYEGNCIVNNFETPLWKLPVFVKAGAIIPMANPNNHVAEIDKGLRIYEIYPSGKTSFTEYDDDGTTEKYKSGQFATTLITSDVEKGVARISVLPANGNFDGFERNKTTEFKINVTQKPSSVLAYINKNKAKLSEVYSRKEYEKQDNVFYYDSLPELNKFATKGSSFEKISIIKNPELLVKLSKTDITQNAIRLLINDYRFSPENNNKKLTGGLIAPVDIVILDSNAKAFSLKPSWSKVSNADYYEIDFDGQIYTTIKDTSLLFDGLNAQTNYTFKLRSVNKTGYSNWTNFSAKTKSNPLEYAIKNITAKNSVADEDDNEIGKLFDFDESDMWHTKWDAKAVPFELLIDLHSINTLDKLEYLPRNRGNGILLQGKIYYSSNKKDWIAADTFRWEKNGQQKYFYFKNHPEARYLKIAVTQAVNDFGSGREMYVFKVPGTKSYVPGDINNDGLINENDLTSYLNYTGLRKGDADFDGYVSYGDVNKNDLIDAYDISTVATQLDGGMNEENQDTLDGKISLSVPKNNYDKNETVNILVKGIQLKGLNALSFALPYHQADYEYIGIEPINMHQMKNMTNDRLHSNGEKVLYPTFVNIGDKPTLNGNENLFIIKLKALRKLNFELKPIDGILVDKHLNSIEF